MHHYHFHHHATGPQNEEELLRPWRCRYWSRVTQIGMALTSGQVFKLIFSIVTSIGRMVTL